MILDKGGGYHGHHVCVRNVVGSLLSLLILTHWRQGTTMPTYAVGGRRGPGGGAWHDPDRLLNKKCKKIIV
jgi:hypothetical protein